jgi:hypothetical protein
MVRGGGGKEGEGRGTWRFTLVSDPSFNAPCSGLSGWVGWCLALGVRVGCRSVYSGGWPFRVQSSQSELRGGGRTDLVRLCGFGA